MMGRKYREQANFFYEFRLDDMIPKGHLLRRINVFVTSVLGDLHEQLGRLVNRSMNIRSHTRCRQAAYSLFRMQGYPCPTENHVTAV